MSSASQKHEYLAYRTRILLVKYKFIFYYASSSRRRRRCLSSLLYRVHRMRENLFLGKELIANREIIKFSPRNLTRTPILSHSNFILKLSLFLIYPRIYAINLFNGHLNGCACPILWDLKSFFTRSYLSKIYFKIQRRTFSPRRKQNWTSVCVANLGLIWVIVRRSKGVRCIKNTLTWSYNEWELTNWKIFLMRYFTLCSREYYSDLKNVYM